MNLQLKIISVIIPLILFFLLILGLWAFNQAKGSTYQSTYRYLDIVLDSYTTDYIYKNYQLLKNAKMEKVKSYIASYQQEAANEAKKVSKDRGGHIFALNDTGQLVFSSHDHSRESIEKAWKKVSQEIAHQNTDIIIKGQLEGKDYNHLYAARFFKPWKWVVFYSVSQKTIDVLINKIILITIGMTVSCAFIGFFIIFLFSKIYLVRPIGKLKDAAYQITAKKEIVTISVYTKDELGMLARNIEFMSQAIHEYKAERDKAEYELLKKQEELQKSKNEIKQHHDSLEKLVDDRTFELNEANKQLKKEIIERKNAENEERKIKERLNKFMESATDGFILFDSEFNHLEMNNAALEITGFKRKDVIGKNIIDTVPNIQGSSRYDEYKKVMKTGVPYHIIDLMKHPLTGDKHIELKAFKVGNGLGIILTDITERKQAEKERKKFEAQLQQTQKLESIGTLAGGVAHEINNPINGIMNYAQLIIDRTDSNTIVAEFASEIIHETKRVSTIVRNLLTFAREEKENHSPARLKDIIDNTMSLIQTVLKKDQICLETDIPEDLPKIRCRSQQIQQVIMNLLTNARDALNEKYPDYHENKKIILSSDLLKKDGEVWIRITVEDRGKGINADIKERLFDPFFTTKPREVGTGLGLSISYGIIKDHHGKLSVESKPDQYTKFHVDLPIYNV